jgi:hypothetical protein
MAATCLSQCLVHKAQEEFFKKNGLSYITAAQNKGTSKTYWLFEGSEKLNMLLQEWRLNK